MKDENFVISKSNLFIDLGYPEFEIYTNKNK